MYKLIALDVDGTLVNSKKELTARVRQSLLRAQSMGANLAIITGRVPCSTFKYAELLDMARGGGYVVGFNGAKIVLCSEPDNVLFEQEFPAEYIKPVCDVLKGRQFSITTYDPDNRMINGNVLTNHVIENSKMLNIPYNFVDNFADYITFSIDKLLILGDEEDISKLEIELVEKFGGDLSIFRSARTMIELASPKVNKGNALKWLCEKLNIKQSECVAFGDSENDISMIKYAGLGVAMGNALDSVKACADMVTATNNQDGVAEVIENLFNFLS